MKKTTLSTVHVLLLLGLVFSSFLISCKKKKADEPAPSNPTEVLKSYPVAGHYTWEFNIGPVEQTSHLVIYSSIDSIGYAMQGGMYTNNYMMHKVSSSEKDGRWVGIGKGGVSLEKDGKYFVLFFKDIKNKEFTVFKKEFETQKEAEEFSLPAKDSQDSHGWNKYER